MSVQTSICAIWVSGKELSTETIRKMRQVKVQFRKAKAASGVLVFEDSDYRLFDSKSFDEGRSITVMMGWRHDVRFFGPFFSKTPKMTYPESGEPQLSVEFQDKSHRMNKKQKRKRHVGNSVTLLKNFAKKYGLKYDIEDPEVTFTDESPLMQCNQTDAALIKKLADRYGYVFRIEGNTLVFRRPDTDMEAVGRQAEVEVLSYKINDFSLRAFTSKMKYTSGRKRKKPVAAINNIDLDTKDYYVGDAALDDVDLDYDYELDDAGNPYSVSEAEDRDVDPNADFDVDADVEDSDLYAGTNSDWNVEDAEDAIHEADLNDPDVETEYDDISGGATPVTEEEVSKRKIAVKMQTDQIITGTAIPHTASTKYNVGDSIILAGLGKRLSGKYTITEVTLVVAHSAEQFTTVLSVERRSWVRDYTVYEKISAASQATENTVLGGSKKATPRKIPGDAIAKGISGYVNYTQGDSEEPGIDQAWKEGF